MEAWNQIRRLEKIIEEHKDELCKQAKTIKDHEKFRTTLMNMNEELETDLIQKEKKMKDLEKFTLLPCCVCG